MTRMRFASLLHSGRFVNRRAPCRHQKTLSPAASTLKASAVTGGARFYTGAAAKRWAAAWRGCLPLVGLIVFALVTVWCSPASAAAKHRILWVCAYHPTFPTFLDQLAGIRSVLDETAAQLDIEFMDSKRFHALQHMENFQRSLRFKLAGSEAYDAILVSEDNAATFATANRVELFPETPIVFFGVNSPEDAAQFAADPWVTGVVEAVSMAETIDLILSLQPQTTTIVALSDGTTTGRQDLKTFYRFQARHPAVALTDISLEHLRFAELPARLAQVGENSVLLLLSAFRDRSGAMLAFDEALALLRTHLRQPIYHLWRHGLGDGILGGKLVSHYHQGRAAAIKVRAILDGRDPATVPLLKESPNAFMFDYRELERFGIPIADLPPDSTVLHQP